MIKAFHYMNLLSIGLSFGSNALLAPHPPYPPFSRFKRIVPKTHAFCSICYESLPIKIIDYNTISMQKIVVAERRKKLPC